MRRAKRAGGGIGVHETSRAKQAYADYVRLGPDRSLEKLLAHYRELAKAPTKQLSALKAWSSAHGWQGRLKADAEADIRVARERQAEQRRLVLEQEDLALDFGRVAILITLAKKLTADLTAEGAEFDEAKYRQLRGILDDIAKEVGDRVQRHEYIMVEKKAKEIAVERNLDPGRVYNFAEELAKRGRAG